MYKCIECGREIDIDLKVSKKIQCNFCGYRILRKLRSPVEKRVLAR